jgi:phosphohistidine phosphatase SixA
MLAISIPLTDGALRNSRCPDSHLDGRLGWKAETPACIIRPEKEGDRVRRRVFLIAALLIPAGCTLLAPQQAVPNIYVMRHLHTPEGAKNPDLTAEGQASAAAMARWLSRDPPSVIFVSNTKRAMQTAAPTALRYGLIPHVYDPSDTAGLVSSILRQQGTVLVVGHSNTVPDIIAGLGGERPAALAHNDFGDVWHIRGPRRVTIRTKLPKR